MIDLATPAPIESEGPFTVTLATNWLAAVTDWDLLGAHGGAEFGGASPFQRSGWIAAWYDTIGHESGARPLVVTVRRRAGGGIALMLPLAERRVGPIRLIEYADQWATDYCEPRLGPAAPCDAQEAALALAAIRSVLAPRADLLAIDKMPRQLGARPNPMTLAEGTRPSRYIGHWIDMRVGYEAWLRAIEKAHRKELGRSLRNLELLGRVEVGFATSAAEALEALGEIERMQTARLDAMHARHPFADAGRQAFYQRLVSEGHGDGATRIAIIRLNGQLVAASLGVAVPGRFTLLRIAFRDEPALERVGLGRLVIAHSMRLAREVGHGLIDLSIGSTAIKRRFMAEPVELRELVVPLTWRGALADGATRIRARLADSQLRELIAPRRAVPVGG